MACDVLSKSICCAPYHSLLFSLLNTSSEADYQYNQTSCLFLNKKKIRLVCYKFVAGFRCNWISSVVYHALVNLRGEDKRLSKILRQTFLSCAPLEWNTVCPCMWESVGKLCHLRLIVFWVFIMRMLQLWPNECSAVCSRFMTGDSLSLGGGQQCEDLLCFPPSLLFPIYI